MSQEARVSSVLVLKELRASLGTFAEIAALALEEASTEIQRTRRWLSEDQYRHWKAQVQVRSQRCARAKIALKQKEVFDRTLAGTPSSCVAERKALRMAETRLREAEQKFSRVKAWSQRIDKEMSDYRGATQRLMSAMEVEIPNARAKLDKMIDSLEAYLALAPPEMPRTTTEPSEVDLVRPGEVPVPPPAEPRSAASPSLEEEVEPSRATTPPPHGNRAPDLGREDT
jgi:hypothetical protein